MDRSLTEQITAFINEIGIPCRPMVKEGDGFLPGIFIENGRILFDPEQMKYPGDLLHEAGHLAVLLPADREQANEMGAIHGDLQAEGAEMAAIAWSWAALQHLQLLPSIVFHENGYRDGSRAIIDNFSEGKYFGVPILQWLGLACRDNEPGDHYPTLKYWLRQG